MRAASEEEVATDADVGEGEAFAAVVDRRIRPHQLVDHLSHLVDRRHLRRRLFLWKQLRVATGGGGGGTINSTNSAPLSLIFTLTTARLDRRRCEGRKNCYNGEIRSPYSSFSLRYNEYGGARDFFRAQCGRKCFPAANRSQITVSFLWKGSAMAFHFGRLKEGRPSALGLSPILRENASFNRNFHF